ncbi:MAG: FdtA/QdtA family cupin domain-containing protein [Bacteroidota bacterium]
MEGIELIQLPKIVDPRGNLSFIEEGSQIPFRIERTYWIYDVPGGEMRGGHAFYEMQEFIVALSGSFDVVLDDGVSKKIISLNRSYSGVYIPKMFWRSLENFSTNSLALVLADKPYNANDYIRDYDLYLKLKNKKQ